MAKGQFEVKDQNQRIEKMLGGQKPDQDEALIPMK